MNHEKMLEEYEITLECNRELLRATPWYYFRKRYKLHNEIERYEQLCLMTFLLTMMDRIETKQEK